MERLLMVQLKRQGWHVVRSAGSKGPVDLVAWNGGDFMAIQVKAPGAVRKADVEKLRKVNVPKCGGRWMYEYDGLGDWKITEI